MDPLVTPPDAQTRPGAPLDLNEYTISIDAAAALYARAGHPRTIRRIQKYCARGDLDCMKVETTFGEKYIITRSSIDRHIAQIEDGLAASGRVQARPDALQDVPEIQARPPIENVTDAVTLTDAPAVPERVGARLDAGAGAPQLTFQDRYLAHLEKENSFLREQNTVLLERVKETNVITAKLQSMLSPFLGLGERREPPENRHTWEEGGIPPNHETR
jgi:hypothetical protein